MKLLFATLGLASAASAHTLFTTFFIDGKNQGDGTCVRQPADPESATAPIGPLTGDVMACGREGNTPVPYICPVSGGASLTFEFRVWPNAEKPGAIDKSHQGPCAVYMKKVDDMLSDSASGPGWFKIWEDGYNSDSKKWCVDTLIENNGLLSVNLPTGLPSGYYLIRPELLALHQAYRGDPQFFHGCAQVFIENGPGGSLDVPGEFSVSIPGHVAASAPGLSFNLYEDDPTKYEIPGPKVFIPKGTSGGSKKTQDVGVIPSDCIIKNANWCGEPVKSYTEINGCWDANEECWAQSKKCWSSAPVSGDANCYVWSDYCKTLESACGKGDVKGPPGFKGQEVYGSKPDSMPSTYGVFGGRDVSLAAVKPAETESESETSLVVEGDRLSKPAAKNSSCRLRKRSSRLK